MLLCFTRKLTEKIILKINYLNGLAAGTIAPPNVPSARKRRAIDWAENLIVEHFKTNSDYQPRVNLASTSSIPESTRSHVLLQTANYLIANFPLENELDELKRTALSSILKFNEVESNTQSSAVIKTVESTWKSIQVEESVNGNSRMKSKVVNMKLIMNYILDNKIELKQRVKRSVLPECCETCQLDSTGRNCYIKASGSYSYSGATSACNLYAPGAVLPSFSSPSDYTEFLAIR